MIAVMSSTTETPSPTPASTPANPTSIVTTTKATLQYRDPPEARALWEDYLTTRSQASRDELVRVYSFLVRNAIAVFLHSRGPNDADEIESAAWAGLLQAVERYDPAKRTPFIGWTLRVIRSRVFDALRKIDVRARQLCRGRSDTELPPVEPVGELTPGRVDARDRIEFFCDLVEAGGLRFDEAAALFFCRFHAFAPDHAADLLGMSRNRLRQTLNRTTAAVREAMSAAEAWAEVRQLAHTGRLPVAPIPRRKPAAH